MNQSPKGKVRLYAAGGCGVNIGVHLEEFRNRNETAFAALDIVYVDTSRSNMRGSSIDQKDCYLLDGLDGSGKVRSENHEEISRHIRMILSKFEPAELNIVLHSAAGGSGSVIGPLLTSELLDSAVPTIVITIGSSETVLDAQNTLKTLKSYESISRMRKAPVIMSYFENNASTNRDYSDTAAISNVMALCVLFSRENHELDSKDLFNFLRYDKVTTFPVQLTSLIVLEGNQQHDDLGNIITVASLVQAGNSASLPEMPEVQYVGFLPDGASHKILSNAPVHFITSDGVLPEVAAKLNKLLDAAAKAKNARLVKQSVLAPSDQSTDTGLVL